MTWPNLSLIAMIASLLLVLAFSATAIWPRVRPIATLGFQLAGVLFLTWALVNIGTTAANPFSPGAAAKPLTSQQVMQQTLTAACRSLLLMGTAAVWGTTVGLGGAFLVTALRRRQLVLIAVIATLVWVIPTFLLAVVAQEIQAQIYGLTGAPVSGGYGVVTPLAIVWAAAVLGIRPAAYIFRQARVALDLEELHDHVRTARAKGLPWRAVLLRHIARPAAGALVAGWLSSFRLMIGSLPLVEFFFGYPGLGQNLVLALGLGYGQQAGQAKPDLAIALVVAMGSVLLILETAAAVLQEVLDPRLRELRTGVEAA